MNYCYRWHVIAPNLFAPVWVGMNSSLAELVDDWHDFDLLIGTAAATLVGLMFVAALIGASIFTEKNRAAMEAFISPTLVHFTTVLVIAVLAVVPTHEWVTLAGLLALVGLAGAIYSAKLWIQLFVQRRFEVDVIDRLFYAAIPLLGSPDRRVLAVAAIGSGPRPARRRADHAASRGNSQRLGHDALDRDQGADRRRGSPRQYVARRVRLSNAAPAW